MTAIRAAFKAYRMHQVLIMPRFARLTIALGLATAVFPVDAEYYFNPRFLSNDLAESVDLSAFTKGREAPPGTYRVDIYLNDEFMTSRDITFIADDKQPVTPKLDENKEVKWININEIEQVVKEKEMIPIYHKLMKRVFKIVKKGCNEIT